MIKVRMYSTHVCPYCQMAARLLEKKGVEFERIYVDASPQQRMEMTRLTGQATVPQIFIGEVHVGGYRELARLDLAGKLDRLLQPTEV